MKEMDRLAAERIGAPGILLMENAGAAVARETLALCRERGVARVHVLCGTGNNGGDGFVAARRLRLEGLEVTYEIVGDADRIRGDALTNLRILRELGTQPSTMPEGAVLVDALLGTGTSGAPREPVASAVRRINEAHMPVVAVDIPSGVDGLTGNVPGEAVRADVTVTLGLPKPGLLLYPGAACVGRLVVDAIGMDWSRTGVGACARWYLAENALRAVRRRRRDAHKGVFGHVLVVGGSAGMTGAPTLAARGALRAGAGLVTVAAPRSAQAIIASNVPEAMTVPLPEQDGALCPSSIDALQAAMERATVACIGPGIGRASHTAEFVRQFVAQCPLPLVVDADALWAISGTPEVTRERHVPTVLTPHPGEAAVLLSLDIAEVQRDRMASAQRLAETYGCVAILKGAGTVVHRGQQEEQTLRADGVAPCTIVTTGNPGMATGGCGDVLTGVVGSLMGQGVMAYEAACLGAFVHGFAGDIVSRSTGEAGLLAGDLADGLAEALKELGI